MGAGGFRAPLPVLPPLVRGCGGRGGGSCRRAYLFGRSLWHYFLSCTSGRGPDQAKGPKLLKAFRNWVPLLQRGSFGQWYSRVSDGKPFPSGNDVSPIDWVHGAVRGDCSQTQHESFFPSLWFSW